MTTPREELLADVAELGREFARLGWTRRLPPLREFYAAIAAGRDRTERFTAALVAALRRVMGLGVDALPSAQHCPRCEPPRDGSWAGARTMMHLDDRWAMQCAKCGAEWVVLEHERHHRKLRSASTTGSSALCDGQPGRTLLLAGAVALLSCGGPPASLPSFDAPSEAVLFGTGRNDLWWLEAEAGTDPQRRLLVHRADGAEQKFLLDVVLRDLRAFAPAEPGAIWVLSSPEAHRLVMRKLDPTGTVLLDRSEDFEVLTMGHTYGPTTGAFAHASAVAISISIDLGPRLFRFDGTRFVLMAPLFALSEMSLVAVRGLNDLWFARMGALVHYVSGRKWLAPHGAAPCPSTRRAWRGPSGASRSMQPSRSARPAGPSSLSNAWRTTRCRRCASKPQQARRLTRLSDSPASSRSRAGSSRCSATCSAPSRTLSTSHGSLRAAVTRVDCRRRTPSCTDAVTDARTGA